MYQKTEHILNQFYDHHSPLKNLFSGFEWKRKQWTRNWEWFGMAFSWSSKVCRVKVSFLLGNVGTFPRNAILMGDKISWRSLLQRTFQVSAGILPLLPTSSITHAIIFKLAAGVKVTSLSDIFNARVNDLSKEAILQCINDGDLRFLSVIEIIITSSLPQ